MEQKNQLAVSNLKQFNATITAPNTQAYLKNVLGEKRASFVNNITALVANNASLQQCDPVTLLYAGIKATALDLPLDQNLSLAHVIPYKNNKTGKVEAQFQLGWRAYVQLGIRSGLFRTINATDIREGELLDYNLLTGEMEFKAAANRDELPIIGYAAYFRLLNGFEKTLYMTAAEMEAHAKRYSQTYSSRYENVRAQSMWTTDFPKMGIKTVLKLLLDRFAPKSVEMREMLEAQRIDQSVLRDGDKVDYVDNPADSAIGQLEAEVEEYANKTVIELEGQEPETTEAAKEETPKETPKKARRTAEF